MAETQTQVPRERMNLDQLSPDHKNARKHNPRNVGTIVDALRDIGPARSIVIDDDGRVLAGNATLEAAKAAGLENVIIVDDPDTLVAVRRSGLTEAQKIRLALYDNRAAEHATWDFEQLSGLVQELQKDAGTEGASGTDVGLGTNAWADYELEPLLNAVWVPPTEDDSDSQYPPNGRESRNGSGRSRNGNGSGSDDAERLAITDTLQQAIELVREARDDQELTAQECIEIICQRYIDARE